MEQIGKRSTQKVETTLPQQRRVISRFQGLQKIFAGDVSSEEDEEVKAGGGGLLLDQRKRREKATPLQASLLFINEDFARLVKMEKHFSFTELKKSPHFTIFKFWDSVYCGEVQKQGKRHGKGYMIYKCGRRYEGEWKDDMREGAGTEVYANSHIYDGQFHQGKPHGEGVYKWSDHEVYQGDWYQGMKHGKGKWIGLNGQNYDGQWKYSLADGYGTQVNIRGDRYEGQWKAFVKQGVGKTTLTNGDCHVGSYSNGKYNGYGRYTWADGSEYEGNFLDGIKEDIEAKWVKSKFDPENCNRYQGGYKCDKKHGHGVFTWKSGNSYNGCFVKDLREGKGYMTWNDGTTYQGHWLRDIQNGEGMLVFPDGSFKQGMFQNNILVQESAKPIQSAIVEEQGNEDYRPSRDISKITASSKLILQYHNERSQPSLLRATSSCNKSMKQSRNQLLMAKLNQSQTQDSKFFIKRKGQVSRNGGMMGSVKTLQ